MRHEKKLLVLATLSLMASLYLTMPHTDYISAPSVQNYVEAHDKNIATEGAARRIASPQESVWGRGSTRKITAMREDFLSNPHRKEFFEFALRHPERGGLYYARKLLSNCSAFRISFDAEATAQLTTDARATVDEQIKRCANLGDADSRQRLDGTIRTSLASLDPLLTQEITLSKDQQQRSALSTVDFAVNLGDPYLMRQALLKTLQTASRFDDKEIDQDQKKKLGAAILIAACSFGVDCKTDPAVVLSCLDQDGCGFSVASLLLDRPRLGVDDRQEILALSEKIANAINRGQVGPLFS